jgi:DNA helicase-2/ATP-dependent DNA helicase PcrA
MINLDTLNPEQQAAVLHTEGPLLVLAGAGSGKTRVLTHRIAHLVEDLGVRPWQILSITFTNKAAREMKERLETLIGPAALDLWVGTFHAICVRILRRDIERLGYDRSFVIYDTDDQASVIKSCMETLGINDKQFPPKTILGEISRAKDEMVTPEQYKKMYANDFRMGRIADAYALYQKKLKASNAVDFDDIILLAIRLLNEHPEVLAHYQDKFRYVLVDEYQDTNTAQYMLVSLFANRSRNLCVVGDDDQMIYGWRGANLRNILDFEQEFPGCRTIKLEQNYRSTKTILEAANQVIHNNRGRKSKKLWTDNADGAPIHRIEAGTEHEEAYFVADCIRAQRQLGRRYGDMAVLYRLNAQSRVFEDILVKQGIPYQIVGGTRYFDRKEIKDVIAWLRMLQNPSDEVSLLRAVGVPRRGIGKTTLDRVSQLAALHGIPMFDVMAGVHAYPELGRAAQNLLVFVRFVREMQQLFQTADLVTAVETLIEKSGIVKELQGENSEQALVRIENIREFVSVAREFVDTTEEEPTLVNFLAQIALVADVDSMAGDAADQVVLMTIHSAKGLEFPVVFLAGLEEGVFPSYRSIDRGGGQARGGTPSGVCGHHPRAGEPLFVERALPHAVRQHAVQPSVPVPGGNRGGVVRRADRTRAGWWRVLRRASRRITRCHRCPGRGHGGCRGGCRVGHRACRRRRQGPVFVRDRFVRSQGEDSSVHRTQQRRGNTGCGGRSRAAQEIRRRRGAPAHTGQGRLQSGHPV